MLTTPFENSEVDFILAGIDNSSPCFIIMLLGDVVICRLGGGIITQFVNCLTSSDFSDSAE
jgi:hypothetical protein